MFITNIEIKPVGLLGKDYVMYTICLSLSQTS